LRIPGSRREAVQAALVSVGLPKDAMDRYPHEFSGGQRQRIAIARAIVARPELVLADEAVSALDLSTRIRIVELLKTLGKSMTLVLVSHDLGVVASLCQKIVILERGRIVESGNTRQVLAAPRHPYTQMLIDSVPRMPG
jgi:ABC-type oligopeptide transport system ATPase subunit